MYKESQISQFKVPDIIAILLIITLPISTAAATISLIAITITSLCYKEYRKLILEFIRHNKLVASAIVIFFITSIMSWLLNYEIDITNALHRLKQYSKLLLIPVIFYPINRIKDKAQVELVFVIVVTATVVISTTQFVYPFIPWLKSKHYFINLFKDNIYTSFFSSITVYLCLYKITKPMGIVTNLLIISVIAFHTIHLFSLNAGRSGQVIFFFLLAWYLLIPFTTRKLLLACGVVITVLGVLNSPLSTNTINRTVKEVSTYKTEEFYTSTGERIRYSIDSAKALLDKPICGHGIGSFTQVLGHSYKKYGIAIVKNPHNQYALVAVEQGIIGVCAILYLFYSLSTLGTTNSRENRKLQGLIAAFAIGCLANSWLMDFTSSLTIIVLFSMMNNSSTKTECRKKS